MVAKGSDRITASSLAGDQGVQVLTFSIDEQDYALVMANVVQVVRMVAITRSPSSPEAVEGMVNVRGKVIPVLNLRRLFALADKPYSLNDHLLIARSGERMVGLIVDSVREVLVLPGSALEPPEGIMPEMAEFMTAVGKLGDKMLLILDLDKLLSLVKGRRRDEVVNEMSALQQRLKRLVEDMAVSQPT